MFSLLLYPPAGNTYLMSHKYIRIEFLWLFSFLFLLRISLPADNKGVSLFSLSGLRVSAPRGCSSFRSVTSRTHTDSCRPGTAATCRPAEGSAAPPGTSATLFSRPASRSIRPAWSPPEPAPSARTARGSWVGTPSCSTTEDTMEEEEEEVKMELMDTLSFPSNMPGQ